MILGIEIAMAIYGLMGLFGGKMTISKTKVVLGAPARLLGAIALTPLPVAFVVILLYVASQNPANPERFADENKLTIALIEAVVVIGIAILVFGIGAAIAVDPREANRRARRAARDDYEDEYNDDRDWNRDRGGRR
jgi:hypothetical protein